ncbi:GNAT family N-acetyltransferase [Arthrobacter bussei]|uniref:GNAT family N-acetyltransferase n=1 Tax=Arthrobacter bussei TaxID=2594179 RepID=A0A7X1TQ69_9MICC|nr:GNAT family N-acetyltransferase [Arthrobacter bussei]MPY12266.1 GNAT family N-acetyltransferase [Arthrobacter bussei]
MSSDEYDAFEMSFPPNRDLKRIEWRRNLATLSSSDFSIREATMTASDARRVTDLQGACEPLSIRSVRDNASMISTQTVLIAEIDETHIGFCVSFPGLQEFDPLFIQVIGVVPEAQRRGLATALLHTAAEREPHRDIALATQDDNLAAQALNRRFAHSIGANIERLHLGTYRDHDLGIIRGMGYRAWIIQREKRIQS